MLNKTIDAYHAMLHPFLSVVIHQKTNGVQTFLQCAVVAEVRRVVNAYSGAIEGAGTAIGQRQICKETCNH